MVLLWVMLYAGVLAWLGDRFSRWISICLVPDQVHVDLRPLTNDYAVKHQGRACYV